MGRNGEIEVSADQTMTVSAEAIALAGAVRAGDEAAFNTVAERHRRELLIHCYRMLGSLQDAEDAVQDALLRAWNYRESLKEGAPMRPWLYRVATNACLDFIGRDPRRSALAAKSSAEAPGAPLAPAEVTWLQPIPDAILEPDGAARLRTGDRRPHAGNDRARVSDRDPAPLASATGGADSA